MEKLVYDIYKSVSILLIIASGVAWLITDLIDLVGGDWTIDYLWAEVIIGLAFGLISVYFVLPFFKKEENKAVKEKPVEENKEEKSEKS